MDRATLPDVLTLEEALAYLRLPVAAVLRQALQGNIPDCKVGQCLPTKALGKPLQSL